MTRLVISVHAETAWHREMGKLSGVFIPLRVTNPLNTRKHWRTVWAKSKNARGVTKTYCTRILRTLPATIILTRYGPRLLDVGCGLNASLKPVRDGVADVFEVDDADPRYTWVYKQEKTKWYGVRVEVQPMTLAETP